MMKRLTTEEFVTKATKVHGGKYDYTNTHYINSRSPITFICPIHGEMTTKANDHLDGVSCSKCSGKFRYDTKTFITTAIKIHGKNEYDYSDVVYKNSQTKVKLTHKCGFAFYQIPASHLVGKGCKKCGQKKSNDIRSKKASDEFISKSIVKHGDKYDYSKSVYVNNRTKVIIGCRVHGDFEQTPDAHCGEQAQGCYECSLSSRVEGRLIKEDEFITRATAIHKGKYTYVNLGYTRLDEKVTITCPKHGDFTQRARDHVYGKGCQKCAMNLSKAEVEIGDFIESLGVKVERGVKGMIQDNQELDIVLPDHNLAIEFNGLYWHTEEKGKFSDYHKGKTDWCNKIGYRLIHIWEDDYRERKDKILIYIKHLVGKSTVKRVYGRHCEVKGIDTATGRKFLDEHHIQGSGPATTYYGTFVKKTQELVAVTSFSKGKSNTRNKDMYELTRHATSCTVIGALGKVIKHFNKPTYTFCDDAFFSGNSYEKAGFVEVGKIAPDYKYVVSNKREHKFLWRKDAIKIKLDIEGGTEREMMAEANIYRIWDCGKTRYELKAFMI